MEWRIFFIGPMSAVTTTVQSDGKIFEEITDYSSHIPRLHSFLVSHLVERQYAQTDGDLTTNASLEKDDDTILTITPAALYGAGAIPANVFDAMDDSDLIIADLSGNRPPVIYELAFAHALGIRTILVGGPKERSFYFSQYRFVGLDFKTEQISSEDFSKEIDRWLKDRNKLFNSPNPLTDFYQAPLPDISAAAGLAAGFYDNFARPILTSGKIVDNTGESESSRKLKGLIVLRPDNFDKRINTIEKELEKILLTHFPEDEVKRGKRGVLTVETDKDGERVPFFLVSDYMIDIPRTMFSLSLSRRLERTSETQKGKSQRHNLQRVLINRFFESVKHHLSKDRNIEEEQEKFHFGSIGDIPDIIKTGNSNSWT